MRLWHVTAALAALAAVAWGVLTYRALEGRDAMELRTAVFVAAAALATVSGVLKTGGRW